MIVVKKALSTMFSWLCMRLKELLAFFQLPKYLTAKTFNLRMNDTKVLTDLVNT